MELGKHFPERYRRNSRTITSDEQLKLSASSVVVVGCGGLGGYIIEEMARLGIGHLIVIDGDRFEETNLNRQLLATEGNLGQWKAEAARERIRTVNSTVRVDSIVDNFEENKARSMLEGAHLVCDALDSIETRLELERACHALGIPLVFASIAGWFGMIGVSFPGDFSVERIFGKANTGVEKIWGNPAFTPAVVASLAVAESVKILTGKRVSLRHSWLQIDLAEMEFERIELG